jgi:bacterioferritin-associated ferredoxin
VIVCSCNVISDHQVRSVAAEHAVRGTSEVYRCLGCSAACGRCARTIRAIMDEVHAGKDEVHGGSVVDSAAPCIDALPAPCCLAQECRHRERRQEEPESGLALAAAS